MTLAVFFPSLMGVGIIASGAFLLSDWLRRLFPYGRLRRRHTVAVGAHGAITDALAAAGYRLAEPGFIRRRLRRRPTYVAVAMLSVVIGGVCVWGGRAVHDEPSGVFFASPWAVGIGYGVGAAAAVMAGVCLVLAIRYHRPPRVMQALIEETPLGRYTLPSATYQTALQIEKEAPS